MFVEESDWKTMKSDEPEDVIVDVAAVQNLPSDGALSLVPS